MLNKRKRRFGFGDIFIIVLLAGIIFAVVTFALKGINKEEELTRDELYSHFYVYQEKTIKDPVTGNDTVVGEFVLKNIIYIKDIKYEGVPGDGNYQLVKVTGTYKEGYDKDSFYSYLTWDDIEFIKEAETELLILEKQGILTDDQKFSVNNPTVISTFNWMSLISLILPVILIGGVLFFIIKNNSNSNNQAFEFSKTRARLAKKTNVTFDDVAGLQEEKEELIEVVDFL